MPTRMVQVKWTLAVLAFVLLAQGAVWADTLHEYTGTLTLTITDSRLDTGGPVPRNPVGTTLHGWYEYWSTSINGTMGCYGAPFAFSTGPGPGLFGYGDLGGSFAANCPGRD